MDTASGQTEDGGFALVLKELISLHEGASKSKDSNNRQSFDLVLRELMAEREKAAVGKAVAAEQIKQQSELMAEREKAAVEKAVTTERLKQQSELMAEREKVAVATERLKQQAELMAEREKAANAIRLQQNDFQLRLQKREHQVQLGEHQVQLGEHQESLEQDRRVELEQQDRQHTFFREVIQQLQEEVKLLRQSGESGKSSVCVCLHCLFCRSITRKANPSARCRFGSFFDFKYSWRS